MSLARTGRVQWKITRYAGDDRTSRAEPQANNEGDIHANRQTQAMQNGMLDMLREMQKDKQALLDLQERLDQTIAERDALLRVLAKVRTPKRHDGSETV